MRYELYKLFVKRRAWIIIILFIIFRLITVFLQPNYVRDYKMEMYRDSYMQHMKFLEGELTEEKESYISEQNKNIQELLKNNESKLIDEYSTGLINEEEFNEKYRLRNSGYKQKQEFEVINERYKSVVSNPQRVYFIYSNGWTALIGNENLDFVLIILLMILIVPIICDEFSTGMYPILRTTLNGGIRLYVSKAVTALIAAVFSATIFFVEECIYFALMFGLPSGSYPLQSLAPFENSPYQLSIIGASFVTYANICFGAVYLAIILVSFSAILKRSLSAIFIGTLSILLPFIIFSHSTMKYLFPTPLGFLLSSGFLRSTYAVTPFSQEIVTITLKQYILTLCLSAGIMVLLFVVGMRAFTGKSNYKAKRKSLVSMICIISLLLTGCSNTNTQSDFNNVLYNKWSYRPEYKDYSVEYDEEDGVCLFYPDSQIKEPIIRDCFVDTNDINLAVMTYIDGDYLYYLNQYSNYHYAIYSLNTLDYSVSCVHEIEWSDNTKEMDMLFGLGFYFPKKMQQDEIVDSFFVHDNQLFISKSNGIYWYDLNDKQEICIFDKKADNLSAINNYIFYTDELMDVYRYDIKTHLTQKIPIGKVERIYITTDNLYCKDLLDKNFYFVNFDGSKKEHISDFDEEKYLKENIK